jgi:probable phosphoglycerate mutase
VRTLWLVRHAATDWTGARWSGRRSDPSLSAAGRRAADDLAAALAGRLPPRAVILASPSRRAVETARPIADRLGVPMELDDDLREVDVGELDGLTFDAASARYPDLAKRLLAGDRDVDWPGGERAADLRTRIRSVLRRLEARSATATVVLVTHGGVIGEVLASVDGPDLGAERWLSAGAAVALERGDGRWRIAERIEAVGDPAPAGYRAPSLDPARAARTAEAAE